MATAAATPEVLWAQRSSSTDASKNYLYVTISVPDVAPADLQLDISARAVRFAGRSASYKRDYAITLDLWGEIEPAECKRQHTAKNVQLVLRKKELSDDFWPRLLSDAKKVHYLKTDFDKWVDEDEQDEAPEDDMAGMGGMGGMGGMPGMGDMSSMMGGAGGIDFSKLGGMGGMPGMGGMDMGEDDEGDDDGDDDDDDDDMPALEGQEGEAGEAASKDGAVAGKVGSDSPVEGKGKAKIEEVE